jgi:uncharacterized membrane protein
MGEECRPPLPGFLPFRGVKPSLAVTPPQDKRRIFGIEEIGMPVIAITLHVIAVIVWIGGMFLGIVAVRPALAELDLPTRARLFAGILGRFLPWVWGAVVTLLATGFYMVFTSFDGGLSGTPWFVRLMMGIGIFMMMLMGHVTFAPFKRLKRAIAAKDETLMTKAMKQMGMLMAVNLALGLVVILAAMMGAYFSTD